jgi:hypothetical protein
LLLAAQPSLSLFCSLSRLRVTSLVLTSGFDVPPILCPVWAWCLIQKVRSLSRVTASSAIGRPESLRRVQQKLSILLSPNSAMVDASLKSCSSLRAVATRTEKPKTSLYHAIKLGLVSVLRTIVNWKDTAI